jgi:hypothetical protein
MKIEPSFDAEVFLFLLFVITPIATGVWYAAFSWWM